MKIPARLLRKAWFIILSDVVADFPKYRQYFDNEVKALVPEELMRAEIITLNSAEGFVFTDPDERVWFDEGLSIKGKLHKIDYPSSYHITDHIAYICKAIEVVTGIGNKEKIAKLRSGKAFITTDAKKKGGIPQIILHKRLSGCSYEGKKVIFECADLETGFESAMQVIGYAIGLLPQLYKHDSDKQQSENEILNELLDELKKLENGDKAQPRTKPQSEIGLKKHIDFWYTSNAQYFENTLWLCMERTDALRSKGKAEFGIGISTIAFYQAIDGMLACSMSSGAYTPDGSKSETEPAVITNTYLNGIATISPEKQFLHIELHRQIEAQAIPGYANFTLALNDLDHQSIMVGHHSYYATRFHKYVTKTVVWLKYEEGNCPISPREGDFSLKSNWAKFFLNFTKDLNPYNDKDEFEEVPMEIRQFLASRELNRLTMPENGISFLKGEVDSLEQWLKVQRQKYHINDEILKICCVEYTVCYYFGETEITTMNDADILKEITYDTLQLSHVEETESFKAKYIHNPQKNPASYSGHVHHKKDSIEVIVTNSEDTSHLLEKNVGLLIFSVPNSLDSAFKDEFNSCKYFTGIISGLNDRGATPIAYSVLLFKSSVFSKRKHRKQIINYFKNNAGNLSIRPKPSG